MKTFKRKTRESRNTPSAKKIENRVITEVPIPKESRSYAGSLVNMFMNPCTARAVHVPDQWTGKAHIVKCTTEASFDTTASSARGVMVCPTRPDNIKLSGNATYATWTDTACSSATRLANGDYQYIRAVGMCAKLIPKIAATSTPPSVWVWQGPHLPSTSRTASKTGLTDKPRHTFHGDEPIEVSWSPIQLTDFTPAAVTQDYDSGADLNGVAQNAKPAIHFEIFGGTASLQYVLEVTTIYECFVSAAAMNVGAEKSHSPTNSMAVEHALNAMPHVDNFMHRTGDLIGRIHEIAGKVSAFIQKPEVAKALMVGKTIIGGLAALL